MTVAELLAKPEAWTQGTFARDEDGNSCVALQMEAKARNCGLRIADEAIAKATEGEL